ncbi:hypothetical protein NXZ84_10015 [Mechercharimyces sp. CAU 1602]|nr:hypothetical protein [Mechercharimyces sp. CAU 1602]
MNSEGRCLFILSNEVTQSISDAMYRHHDVPYARYVENFDVRLKVEAKREQEHRMVRSMTREALQGADRLIASGK